MAEYVISLKESNMDIKEYLQKVLGNSDHVVELDSALSKGLAGV
jgi:hypothetical protein